MRQLISLVAFGHAGKIDNEKPCEYQAIIGNDAYQQLIVMFGAEEEVGRKPYRGDAASQ